MRASFIVIAIQQGANYPLTSAEDGVALDIDGDGDLDRVAWTRPNSNVAFLALDHDGDGTITSGRELFGNFTTPGASNGFIALARLAEETNGGARRPSVSADDPLFARLLLWTDSNHNGVSEPSELRPASEKITDIGLGYQRNGRQDQWGNSYRFKGWVHVRTAPGRNKVDSAAENSTRTRPIYDVYFRVIQ